MASELTERARLRQFLQNHFNLEELKTLAFDLGIDYELFPHDTVPAFTRELIAYCQRMDKIACLLTEVSKQRPISELEGHIQELGPSSVDNRRDVVGGESLSSNSPSQGSALKFPALRPRAKGFLALAGIGIVGTIWFAVAPQLQEGNWLSGLTATLAKALVITCPFVLVLANWAEHSIGPQALARLGIEAEKTPTMTWVNTILGEAYSPSWFAPYHFSVSQL